MIEDLVSDLGKRGIYTIIDSHQNLFSSDTCGQGVPPFYAKGLASQCAADWKKDFISKEVEKCESLLDFSGVTTDSSDLVDLDSCQSHKLNHLYSSAEVRDGFQRFYDNRDGLFDKYLGYWTKVAQKFRGNENVIGFDLLNEPWPATIASHEEFDSTLAALYETIGETIRAVDSDKVLFFQPSAFPGVVPNHAVKNTEFGTNPLAERNNLASVLSQHVYCCANDPANCKKKHYYAELSSKGLETC